MNMEFDEIRPYHDEELPQIYEELIADPAFQQVASAVFPEVPFEALAQKMRTMQDEVGVSESILLHNPEKICQRHDPGSNSGPYGTDGQDIRLYLYL